MVRHTGAALCLLLGVGLVSALSLLSRSAAANRASVAATHNSITDAGAAPTRTQLLHTPTSSITILPGPPTTPVAPPTPPLATRPAAPPGCSLPNLSLPGRGNASPCIVPIPLARSGACVTLVGLADASSCAPPRVPVCPPSGFIPVDQPGQACATVPRGAILIGHSAP